MSFLAGLMWAIIGFFAASVVAVQVLLSYTISLRLAGLFKKEALISLESFNRLERKAYSTISINVIILVCLACVAFVMRHPISFVGGFGTALFFMKKADYGLTAENLTDWLRVNLQLLTSTESTALQNYFSRE